MVSFWKACNCRNYDELVDPLLSQLAQRTHALYKIIASKEITSSTILIAALESWDRDGHDDVSTLEIH